MQNSVHTMSRYREWDLSCKVYVGDLGSSASKHEIENAFSKYGPLRNVWVARNPPGFAFQRQNCTQNCSALQILKSPPSFWSTGCRNLEDSCCDY
ncbi:Similar to Rbp1: RNA-binding protein 1 (Drosophila melanogaster) [Cotesia congregata]|uniref:Similar to Rbp1: RNA-binding protein 1 (Drosophila melanogaster) n=1 Tax=Cotesia congregata TaxID=51543 RepID=A0A8J2HER8_COTCN|nr:Similar to Rbp1: RNA-binding protein 1 (Drosophila melanogaster) [Cotesia congregata]